MKTKRITRRELEKWIRANRPDLGLETYHFRTKGQRYGYWNKASGLGVCATWVECGPSWHDVGVALGMGV